MMHTHWGSQATPITLIEYNQYGMKEVQIKQKGPVNDLVRRRIV